MAPPIARASAPMLPASRSSRAAAVVTVQARTGFGEPCARGGPYVRIQRALVLRDRRREVVLRQSLFGHEAGGFVQQLRPGVLVGAAQGSDAKASALPRWRPRGAWTWCRDSSPPDGPAARSLAAPPRVGVIVGEGLAHAYLAGDVHGQHVETAASDLDAEGERPVGVSNGALRNPSQAFVPNEAGNFS